MFLSLFFGLFALFTIYEIKINCIIGYILIVVIIIEDILLNLINYNLNDY